MKSRQSETMTSHTLPYLGDHHRLLGVWKRAGRKEVKAMKMRTAAAACRGCKSIAAEVVE
jgi:hypothetical protein